MRGVAGFTRAPVTGDGAKKGHRVRLRLEIGERFPQRLGGRLHERMVERMINAHEPGEDTLRLEFGKHRFQRNAGAGEGQRTRTIKCRNGGEWAAS